MEFDENRDIKTIFFRNGINNINESFNAERYRFITSKSVKLLDREKLLAQYNSSEFDQILYELRHKTSWALECFKGLETSTQNLKLALQFYLDKDYQSLESMESLNYYMNE